MFKAIVYILTSITFLFEQYLSFRQYRRLLDVKKRPAEIVPLLSQEDFVSTRLYGIDKAQLGFFRSTYGYILTICVVYFDIYALFWNFGAEILLNAIGARPSGSAEWMSYEIFNSLFYLALLTVTMTLLDIPFDLYSTFVVEQRHGFNNQTIGLYVTDTLKQLLLGVVIGGPTISLLIWIIRISGTHFYFYIWAFMVVFQLLIITIYPTLIQPLFNKVEPLPDGALKRSIEDLAKRIKFPLTKLFVIDGSKRSNHSNAYFYGFFNNKRIVLFDTLIEQVKEIDEIVAVLGHEIGHWHYSHTLKMMLISQLHLFGLFYLFSYISDRRDVYESFGFGQKESDSYYIPIVISFQLFSFFYSPLESLVSFIINNISRHFEFQADKFAKSLKMENQLVNALIKLSAKNKGMLWPDPWYSAWNHSHPPVIERISALGVKVDNDNNKAKESGAETMAEKKEKYLFEKVLKRQ